jgi:hypothetical protein
VRLPARSDRLLPAMCILAVSAGVLKKYFTLAFQSGR